MNKMRIVRVALAVALFAPAAFSGCKALSGDQYAEIQVPAEKLRDVSTLDLAAMSKPAEAPAPSSPSAFASTEVSLTIEDCRTAALRNNLDLKVTLINPTISGETVRQEEARFEPYFSAGAALSKTDTPSITDLDNEQGSVLETDLGVSFPLRTGGTLTFSSPLTRFKASAGGFESEPVYDADAGFSISQPLLRGAGVRANTYGIRIARYDEQAAEARTKLEVIRVIAAVDRVYWRLYAARKELEVRNNELALAQAQLDRARRKVAAGTASEVETIRAETGVAERLEAIIIAETNVRQRERELKRSLNEAGLAMEAPTAIVPATEPHPTRHDLDTARLVKAAVDSRMEMLELELQIARDASTVDFQRNQALPLLALDYTYNVSGIGGTPDDAYDLLLDKRFEDHSLGLELLVPLGNKAAASRVRQAIFSRAQRLATKEARRSQITQEVLDAVDQIEANWQRVLANRQRTLLAARNLDAETRQFELGLRTSTDVLEAQARLADAQSAEINSLAEYQIAEVDLAFATGNVLGAAKVEWQPAVPKLVGK